MIIIVIVVNLKTKTRTKDVYHALIAKYLHNKKLKLLKSL